MVRRMQVELTKEKQMDGEREEGDARCTVCGEWYWFEIGFGGDWHCSPFDKQPPKKHEKPRAGETGRGEDKETK